MDFHEAVRSIRESTPFDPRALHGRRTAVFDLLADSGAPFDRFAPGTGEISQFAGVDVVYNEAMPADTVELHSRDGRMLRRLVQADGQWREAEADPIEMFPTSR